MGMLKFIGILLLCLMAIFLAVVCLVLFVPVRYKIFGSVKEKRTNLDIHASWLLHSVSLRYLQGDESNSLTIKILFFTIGKGRNQSSAEKKESNANISGDLPKEDASPSPDGDLALDEKDLDKDNSVSQEQNDRSTGIFARFQEILDKVGYYVHYPDKDAILSLAAKYSKLLFKWNRPKTFILRGEAGFEYPHTTGYFMGFISVVQAWIPLDLQIKGNFEKQCLSGQINCTGKASVFSLGYPILRFLLTKPVWRIVKKTLFSKNKRKHERNEIYV